MPSTESSPDPLLLDRYFAGEATAEERQSVEFWLSAHPDEQPTLTALQTAIAAVYGPLPPYDRQARIGAVVDYSVRAASRHRRQSRHSATQGRRPWFGVRSLRQVMWLTGSSIAFGIILASVGWLGGMHHVGGPVTSMSTYTTTPGQRATITLPDGNTVSLGVASRLDVPADYGRGQHTVRLTGEALFTVAHRDRAPFAVLVGTTAVRVLGTSFVVRNYTTDQTTLVAVRDGKVAVRSAVVGAQQQAEVSRDGVTRIQPADPARFSFATGVLTLDHIPFSAAIEELNRWYDADIRLGDPRLRTRKIAAELKVGSLTELAEMLSVTFDVRVVRDGRVLTLFPR